MERKNVLLIFYLAHVHRVDNLLGCTSRYKVEKAFFDCRFACMCTCSNGLRYSNKLSWAGPYNIKSGV